MAKAYTQSEMRLRAINRLAEIFHNHWEEERVGSTRIFEHVIPDEWLVCGRSTNGGGYREHVVPCALIRDHSIRMYQEGKLLEDVVEMIDKYLAIVLISDQERDILDNKFGLKTTMPDGWSFESGDLFARLSLAGIEIITSESVI